MAELILYRIIPTIISFDKAYVGLQNYWALKALLLSDGQTLLQLETVYAELYAQLLPILGSYFLAKFDKCELIEFYLQCQEFNIEISLENFLANASHNSLSLSPFLSLALSNRKQEFLKNRVEHLFYIENVRSNIMKIYLKWLRLYFFYKLRHTFKLRLTQKWKNC
jgi:hypothetical protein